MKTKSIALRANAIRQDVVRMLAEAGSGHTAGSLGMADVFATLYYAVARNDPKRPKDPARDYVFLSNGHICPVLYTTLAHRGYFSRKQLFTFRKIGSKLQGHPHMDSVPGLESSSGPLGQGLSQSCGAALGLKRDKKRNRVYCLAGDGELDEGQCWEAAMFAANYKLDNLCWVIDRNNIQIDGPTDDVMRTRSLAEHFAGFGWEAVEVEGHDVDALKEAFARARATKGRPTVIVAFTVPGKGVKEFENDYRWHGKPPSEEEAARALEELEEERKALEGRA